MSQLIYINVSNDLIYLHDFPIQYRCTEAYIDGINHKF